MTRQERLARVQGMTITEAARVLRADRLAAKRAAHGELTPAVVRRKMGRDVARAVRS